MSDVITSTMPPTISVWTRDGRHFETSDVIGYTSARGVENPVATARVMLPGDTFANTTDRTLRNEQYSDVLRLYDVVQVKIRDREGKQWTDLIGVIQSIELNARDSSGYPSTDTAIEVRSMGEYLQRSKIWYSTQLGLPVVSNIDFFKRVGRNITGRPDHMLETIYKYYINDKYGARTAQGRRLDQVLELQTKRPKDGAVAFNESGIGYENSLWELLTAWADRPWNLLHVDVPHEDYGKLGYGTKERIYLQPTPFSTADWANLRTTQGFVYDGSDRIDNGEQLVESADNIINMAWVTNRAYFANYNQLNVFSKISGGRIPVRDEDSIRRYGLRRMEVSSVYTPFLSRAANQNQLMSGKDKRTNNTQKQRIWEFLESRARDLLLWFGYVEGFTTGSITTVGRIGMGRNTGARIGGVLINEVDGREYWISQIEQSWDIDNGMWLTRLGLERGHKPAAYKRWVQLRTGDLNASADTVAYT